MKREHGRGRRKVCASCEDVGFEEGRRKWQNGHFAHVYLIKGKMVILDGIC